MRTIIRAILFILIALAFSGCSKEAEPKPMEAMVVEPVVIDRPITLFEDFIKESQVDLILVEVLDSYWEPQRFPLVFTDHGLIKGYHHIMVPLTQQPISAFSSLGIEVNILPSGVGARLVRDGVTVDMHIEDITLFVNDVSMAVMNDPPFVANGTLYAPLELLLDAFEIPFQYEENRLIILLGGS